MKKPSPISIPKPMELPLRVLQWELPLIMLWSVALLVLLLQNYPVDPVRATRNFMNCLEYIGASLVLSVATAVISDLILREGK